MSLELIGLICSAERDALEAKRLVEKQAADIIAEAHAMGMSSVDATLARADSEIAHLIRASDQIATEDAAKLASSTENRIATLRARAERRLSDVATMIFDRITGGVS